MLFQFICEPSEVHAVKKNLEAKDISVSETSMEYIPHTFATLAEPQQEIANDMLDKLESTDMVVRVFDNITTHPAS